MNIQFQVNKKDIRNYKIKELTIPEIGEGEVLFRIDRYAFTANNTTYAVLGDMLKYWNFFPADEENGIVPVWGFAEVVASKNEAINIGDYYYGYYPMSTYLKVEPVKNTNFGFVDGAAHRQEMAAIYNFYELTKNVMSQPLVLDYAPIFRPLFTTGFLSYYFLKETNFFNAKNIILTSASSKTALAQAYMLHQNAIEDGNNIIGLTSLKNKAFVEQTGFYNQVLTYNQVDQIPIDDAIIIDFTGRGSLINEIFEHLGDHLKYASMIGLTDWQANRSNIVFPKAKMFFAPGVAQEYGKKWGQGELMKRIGNSLHSFLPIAKKWMDVKYTDNHDDLAKLYMDTMEGNVSPATGCLVKIVK